MRLCLYSFSVRVSTSTAPCAISFCACAAVTTVAPGKWVGVNNPSSATALYSAISARIDTGFIPAVAAEVVNQRATFSRVSALKSLRIATEKPPGTGPSMAGPVPGGFSVAIRKDLSTDAREKVARWFTTSAATAGMKPVSMRAEMAEYKAVAELGLFTPTHLPGATVVTAAQAQKLMAQGAVLVDTRTEKEYKHKRIAQAVFAPYHEKSLKDVAFDAWSRTTSRRSRKSIETCRRSSRATAPSAGSPTRQAGPRSPRATGKSIGSAAGCPSGTRSACPSSAARRTFAKKP